MDDTITQLRDRARMPAAMPDSGFWDGKSVLVTGHTGFKGSWLCVYLRMLGARVTGYALDPPTEPSVFEDLGLGARITDLRGDIRDPESLAKAVSQCGPEVIFHLAAQPLVLESYRNPIETLDINVTGTARVLLAARHAKQLSAFINVTTDKCYRNAEEARPFTEKDHLGGKDVYSASKACSELVTDAIRHSFFHLDNHSAHIATARAGNVIGGGDWAEHRLVPDAVRAFTECRPLVIRHPQSVRPWQHVLEPLSGYLLLAEHLSAAEPDTEGAWNFGPRSACCWEVGRVAEALAALWGKDAEIRIEPGPEGRESGLLQLDSTKSQQGLHWEPSLDLNTALAWTMDWYRARVDSGDLYRLTESQIRTYLETGS